ncbi:MAG: hypothetical protein LBE91_20710 [Tannerella sp.]|jgi:hypothetical protein|nr:hypothetical protein [Tannerella sp.]
MNFLNLFKRKRVFFSNKKLPDRIIKFFFMDNSYILEEFSIDFQQEINKKGRPDGLPTGGVMELTFAGAPDYYINEWMLREELKRNGEIRFFSGKLKVTGGADLIITFEDAYCVDYKKHVHTLKGGLFTTIRISPRSVKIGEEEFENKWKRDEDHPFYIRSGKIQ